MTLSPARHHILALAVLMVTSTGALLVPTEVQASGGCDWQISGTLPVGLLGEKVDGVSHVTEPVPEACGDETFRLEGSNPGDDFDVCFTDEGQTLACYESPAEETGLIPGGATHAEITYWVGAAGTYHLQAPTGAADPIENPATLYLHSRPTGTGQADLVAGESFMDRRPATGQVPSLWHSSWAISGGSPSTVWDANWAWEPDRGYAIDLAPVRVTFHATAAGTGATLGVVWYVDLYSDGERVATNRDHGGTRSGAVAPGEVVEITVDLGLVTTGGQSLTVQITPRHIDTGAANAILYDSQTYPSRVSIGDTYVDDQPPSQVQDLTAGARNDTALAVAWSPAEDDVAVDRYEVLRGTDPDQLSPAASLDGTLHLDTGLEPNTTYHYRVRAVDTSGNVGPVSNLANATTAEEGASVAPEDRSVTVVAVVDDAFNPYHFDLVGHQHPWNRDTTSANDVNLFADPATYIEGYPGAQALPISIPTDPGEEIADLQQVDASLWAQMAPSSADQANLHWLPGTKVIGALNFSGSFLDEENDGDRPNSLHGTRSAASAAGNWHGACPECLVVLVEGFEPEALRWAASQPWIDVVSNSYGHSTAPVVRDNLYTGGPIETTRAASEAGQFVVFSAGNGLANAFGVPTHTYTSSEKGPDWMITVGAVAPGSNDTYVGAGKPVDIASIGSGYPSTGGTTANGTGTHSGTSNAAPVVAGTLAKVLQLSRQLLDDTTSGHADGIVAQGDPVTCGPILPACPLGDGVLTRAELRDLVFHNVLPSPTKVSCCQTTMPSTEHAYYHQGHGIVHGILDGRPVHRDQVDAMVAVATGDQEPPERPTGETDWFVIDSKCRQKIWGSWSGGSYDGTEPDLDPIEDPLAIAYDQVCSQL